MAEQKPQTYKTEEQLKAEALARRAEEAKIAAARPKSEVQKKRENFWYHYKWHTIAAVFVVVITAFFLKDFFAPKPDATIVMAVGAYVPQEELDALTASLEAVAEDFNGDKKILIAVDYIRVGAGGETAGQQDYAMQMKLMAVVSANTEKVFILDDVGLQTFKDMSGGNLEDVFAPDTADAAKLGAPFSGMRFYLRTSGDSDKDAARYEYGKKLIEAINSAQ